VAKVLEYVNEVPIYTEQMKRDFKILKENFNNNQLRSPYNGFGRARFNNFYKNRSFTSAARGSYSGGNINSMYASANNRGYSAANPHNKSFFFKKKEDTKANHSPEGPTSPVAAVQVVRTTNMAAKEETMAIKSVLRGNHLDIMAAWRAFTRSSCNNKDVYTKNADSRVEEEKAFSSEDKNSAVSIHKEAPV
jgi:hypothetical protein